jgi:hypothetical protein
LLSTSRILAGLGENQLGTKNSIVIPFYFGNVKLWFEKVLFQLVCVIMYLVVIPWFRVLGSHSMSKGIKW